MVYYRHDNITLTHNLGGDDTDPMVEDGDELEEDAMGGGELENEVSEEEDEI